MAREIYVDVPRSHTQPIQVGVNGEKGEGCKDLTKRLEAALGSVESDEPTQEMYEAPIETNVRVREGGGQQF